MYQMQKTYVVRISWNAGAGLAVCKVVSSVLPSRDALGAEQGLTKFIHPRLDEGIMLLYSWRCGFGCQEVQRSVFQGAAFSLYPLKNRSFRAETLSITYYIQKLTRHDGDSAKTGHLLPLTPQMGGWGCWHTAYIYIYINRMLRWGCWHTVYIYTFMYICVYEENNAWNVYTCI